VVAAVLLACVRGDDEDACDTVVRGADRRKNRSRLKIATFNLYWLFLEDWMTGIKPDGPWASKAAAEKHASRHGRAARRTRRRHRRSRRKRRTATRCSACARR
jgi:hypothetical protein